MKNKFMDKIKKYFNEKMLMLVAIGVFFVSLLPIFYLAFFNYATGDDYGYGAKTHIAWENTHSFIEVCKAMGETVAHYYYGWQGTWFSIALFSLQPEVFSPKAYVIVPFLMVGILTAVHWLLFDEIFVKILKSSMVHVCILCSIFLCLMIQFIPHPTSGIFWYNGAAHYIIPYGMAITAITMTIKYIRILKTRFLIAAIVLMTLLGGTNYLAVLLAPLLIIPLIIIFMKKDKKIKFLWIAIVLEFIGLYISMLSPGNTIRAGEDFGFSISLAFLTIIQSIEAGILQVGTYCIEKHICVVFLLALVLIVGEMILQSKVLEQLVVNQKKYFRYPLFVVVYFLGVYCAMFAPGIYAGTELSGGVPNTIFQVFLLMVLASEVYILGWVKEKGWNINNTEKRKTLIWGTIAFICMIVIVIGRSSIKDTTFYNCLTYITSGQADDYKMQMEERFAVLLDDSIQNAEVPMINDVQGPLMHMPSTDNPEDWSNVVSREFYQKESVVAVSK
ncbi:MAG: DUF6056 family protein [Eubacteriales bacterium]